MNRIVGFFIALVVVGCSKSSSLFENPSPEKTGITFANTITESDDLNILDYLYFYNGGGVAVGDVNGDDLPDIFFSGNQIKNKLYLNKGNLEFQDISKFAGVEGNSTWNTGAIMGDVNGDGLLDIYVCAVVGINGFDGHNELYINNGPSGNSGAVTFTESSIKYGLDFDSYSSSAAFLDYDLDGDLDLYLLNHAVHTQDSYGKADLRYKRNYETGDKLLRNDGGRFTEVSEEAGIYGGINGYGLGVAVSDFNQDGYPDIYVGNDFHEDDYYYLNNGDGTFSESLKEHFGHISRFSMGNDVADINHDGLPDMISLDMLPEDEIPLKSSEGDDNVQTQKLRIEQYGYHYQFTRNMLYVNQADGNYMETALMSGVAATDWSWSALFADYDQDGEQDIFVSNGIPKRPNDLDFINFLSSDQIQSKVNNTKLVDQTAIDMMPSGATHNYVFKGKSNLEFENMSSKWISNDTLISGATALGDFDNDGDIDVVTSNLNSPASLYINKTNGKSNYLKIKFDYPSPNKFGIGTKVYAYVDGQLQFKELYLSRGFQASSEPIIHFGFGSAEKLDSLKVIWPNKTYQVLYDIKTNQTLTLSPQNTKPFDYDSLKPNNPTLFRQMNEALGIDFVHKEDNYVDFNREKLIPYKASDRGPALAIGDINNDGKEDIFIGGSKFISSQIFVQKDSAFVQLDFPEIMKDSIKENVSAVIADFNGDQKNDLVIGNGGADFFGESNPLMDNIYFQSDSTYVQGQLPEFFQNAAVIKPYDYDQDGDLDIFIGNHMITSKFGATPTSYLLNNTKGTFSIVDGFVASNVGMVTDALWHDFDADGTKDLIVIGEWMSPKFFKNTNGTFSEANPMDLNGLWQTIEPFDIDQDGDDDYLLGNWGKNSKFKASKENPLKMYFSDFDDNGSTETIIVQNKNGKEYPIHDLDDLASQMVSLRKKFNSYTSFAGKEIKAILDEEAIKKAKILSVTELRSGYLKNNGGSFEFVPFTVELQVAPITDFLAYDFDGDGSTEILAGGNYFGVKPYHGRFDSFPGALIKNENNVILGNRLGLNFNQKSLRHLEILSFKGKNYLLAIFNNEKAQLYQLNN
ncbi:VCBS repeat-containing protein [Flagellimonas sp.]|uniref:VCBS repeat-containing protein n=1 Tax=Flagellimonas sp. TaxID=2058762 RepID=UPI003B5075EA